MYQPGQRRPRGLDLHLIPLSRDFLRHKSRPLDDVGQRDVRRPMRRAGQQPFIPGAQVHADLVDQRSAVVKKQSFGCPQHVYNLIMKSRILFGVMVAASLSSAADAHFVLVQPAASTIQNRLGDPQKIAPCGGVSANPGRGTPANPGVPSGAITNVKGGTELPLLVHESIYHPGHYRVALARTMAQLPKDPEVTTMQTEKGSRSQSAVIQNPPVAPILLDGIFVHTEKPASPQTFDGMIPIPNINCPSCVLQVIEFMAEHPGIAVDGGHSYHHCAILNITADSSKPIDKRW